MNIFNDSFTQTSMMPKVHDHLEYGEYYMERIIFP